MGCSCQGKLEYRWDIHWGGSDLDGGRGRFFRIYHQKYRCGIKHMKSKNGPFI